MRRRRTADPPEAFRQAVAIGLSAGLLTRADLAGALGISQSALCKRLQDPGAMRVRDLAAMLQILEDINIKPVLGLLQVSDRQMETIREEL